MKRFFYDSIDSTHNEAKRLLSRGERDFLVVARHQTAGRGSRDRSFLSAGGGLYLSIVLPMKAEPVTAPCIVAAAACAVALSRLCGRQIGCKWVNDLILDGKKIGGILSELHEGNLIVGIGINVKQQSFPTELSHVSSLALCCGRSFDLVAAERAVIQQLLIYWQDEKAALSAYRQRLLTLNREVSVLCEGKSREGFALELEDSGALRVRFADSGLVESLHSGQVSIRGAGSEKVYL
ncbi:MAG: biotin--[Oscillospiraceae bacterium]|nr:biotin--[acetyl-CoA-carboxylase] ligase [Oscillospiraceae bacterium]